MAKKNNQNKNNFNLDEFIYKTQFRRTIHPMYLPFTKVGFLFSIISAYLLYLDGISLFNFFFIVGGVVYLYKNQLVLKYYQKESSWIYLHISNFLTKRIKRPFESHFLYFD